MANTHFGSKLESSIKYGIESERVSEFNKKFGNLKNSMDKSKKKTMRKNLSANFIENWWNYWAVSDKSVRIVRERAVLASRFVAYLVSTKVIKVS